MKSMKFSIDWLNVGDNRAAEIASTICSWEIELAGTNITKFALRDKDEAPKRMITSCYPIADGIIRSWWYLLSSTSGRLSLKKYREGFIFPDIVIEPEEAQLNISAIPCRYENPRISFVSGAREVVSKDDARAILGDLIEQVLRRLRNADVSTSALAERWDWITRSTLDAEEILFCEAAGAAGLDPYACSNEEANAIEHASEVFSHENLLEFLSGESAAIRRSEIVQDVQSDIGWYKEESKRIGAGAALPSISEARAAVRPDTTVATPYSRGYATAQRFRSFIDVRESDKLPDSATIAHRLGNSNFEYSPKATHSLRGVVEPHLDSARVILPLFHREDSRAFALARGIGDYLMFGDTGPAALTDTYSARQASGRAFAAEFLAPATALRELKLNGWPEDEIAREFGVGEKVVEYQLKNLSQLV
jgi:hypothetical protein